MKKLAFLLIVLMQCVLPVTTFAEQSTTTKKGTDKPPAVASEAAVLIDSKTGQVVYEKNPDERLYPASITKILTGIIAIEQGNLNDIVTTSKKARNVEGTRVYLAEGEQVRMEDLLFGLLMNSGNDAAIAIAEHMDGSTEKFAERMNKFAASIGATHSHFTNPHGLFDQNHYTTAGDMAKIAAYAMKNPKFREIVGTKKRAWNGKEWKTTIINHNILLGSYPGCTGIKNGYVDESRHTLVTSALRDGTEFITVIMKAQTNPEQYQDTTNLLDYGFSHYRTATLLGAGQVINYKGKQYTVGSDVYGTVPLKEKYHVSMNEKNQLVVSTPSGKTAQIDPQFVKEVYANPDTGSLSLIRVLYIGLWSMVGLAMATILLGFYRRIRA